VRTHDDSLSLPETLFDRPEFVDLRGLFFGGGGGVFDFGGDFVCPVGCLVYHARDLFGTRGLIVGRLGDLVDPLFDLRYGVVDVAEFLNGVLDLVRADGDPFGGLVRGSRRSQWWSS